MPCIFAFGDSITYGAWDMTNAGWATKVRLLLDAKQDADDNFYALVYNLGIPGETTEGLVKRFKSETSARFRVGEEAIFIFAFGANDSAFLPSQNRFKVDVEKFARNIEETVLEARQISSKIILLNITPVVDVLTVSPEGKDKSRLNKYIEPYNKKLQEIADKYSVPLIDVFSAFTEAGTEHLFDEDGFHPNTKGHQIIFELVKEKLEVLLGTPENVT